MLKQLCLSACFIAALINTPVVMAEWAADASNPDCISTYVHGNYSGAASQLCPTPGAMVTEFSSANNFTNDAISSIGIPEGMAVEACEHGDGSGQCRTYFKSVNGVDEAFNDSFSLLRVIRFDYNDFYMAISSDPQYPWSCRSSGQNCDDRAIADRDNANQVASMNAILNNFGKQHIGGSIINGDLTAFGHGWQLDKYSKYYETDLQMNNYLGLGNHDYENNVDDTAQNNAATRMVWHLRDQVKTLNVGSFDYAESGTYGFPFRRDHSRSLAYSWDVGDVHFVQLNNHPDYKRSWNGWNWGSARRDYFNIESALPWLRSDLSRAYNAGKKIILNFHIYTTNAELLGIMRDYKVSAIFAGHYHSSIGNYDTLRNFHGPGKHLRVFLSGAAVFNNYLLAQFNDDQLIVKKVDSSTGSGYSLTTVGSYPLYSKHSGSKASNLWLNSGGKDPSAVGNAVYNLDVTSAEYATIDLQSVTDAYLYLLSETGVVLASNDDGGTGVNSRINYNLSAGKYQVVAATYYAGQSGDFTLSTTAGKLSLHAAQQVTNAWYNAGGRSATSSDNPHYTLAVPVAASVTIDMMSNVDTYLYLLNASGAVIASNDDGGDGYNSRITHTLAAGSYKVVAASYSLGKSGSFVLKTTHGQLMPQ